MTEPAETAPPSALPFSLPSALPMGVFGVLTALLIQGGTELLPPWSGRLDLLLFAAGGGALGTAFLWLLWLGLRRGPGWAFTWTLAIWIPYVNLLVASVFARRYWKQGARAPGLLGLAGGLAQAAAFILLLFPDPVPIV